MSIEAAQIEPKAVEILDSIRGVFATKGFDGASMQDLSRAAGMSAGNFYRYFPSKDAIIETIVARDLDTVQSEFRHVMESSDPKTAFLGIIRNRLRVMIGDEDGPLWAEIEAAAVRRPEIAEISQRMQMSVLDYVTRVLAVIAGTGADQGDVFKAHAMLIFMLVKSVAIQGCAGHAQTPVAQAGAVLDGRVEELVMRVVEQIISDAVATARGNTSA